MLKQWYQSDNIHRRYWQKITGGVSNKGQCMNKGKVIKKVFFIKKSS